MSQIWNARLLKFLTESSKNFRRASKNFRKPVFSNSWTEYCHSKICHLSPDSLGLMSSNSCANWWNYEKFLNYTQPLWTLKTGFQFLDFIFDKYSAGFRYSKICQLTSDSMGRLSSNTRTNCWKYEELPTNIEEVKKPVCSNSELFLEHSSTKFYYRKICQMTIDSLRMISNPSAGCGSECHKTLEKFWISYRWKGKFSVKFVKSQDFD